MSKDERQAWVMLIVSAVGITIYTIVIASAAGATPVEQIDWITPMLWTTGIAIVASILLSIVWGIAAGIRHPDEPPVSDVRDRDISWLGDRVGQAFLVIGGLAAIVLCAFAAKPFWIAQAVYAGFALSAIVGGVARVIVYRRGMP